VFAGFVRDGVVDDDDTVTAPACVVGLLKQVESFGVEVIFVPVVLGKELVQRTLAFRWENVRRDPLYGLVAGPTDPVT
jgi:hypothetical protein